MQAVEKMAMRNTAPAAQLVPRVGEQHQRRRRRGDDEGTRKLRRMTSALALRHGTSGPMPVRSSSATPIGAATVSKKPRPTLIRLPWTSSVTTGKSVPQMIANASPTSRRLL